MWRKKTAKQIARDMVCTSAFTITTTDDRDLRYCVPMDDHRPGLNLRFFKDVCPDENGASSLIFMAVFNILLSKYLSLQCSRNMTSFYSMSKWIYRMTQINTQMAMCLKLRRNDFKSTICVRWVTTFNMSNWKVRLDSGAKVGYWFSSAEMHSKDSDCNSLVEKTAAALNNDAVVLMLLAVQRDNVGLSVKTALRRWVHNLMGQSVISTKMTVSITLSGSRMSKRMSK